LSWHWPVGVSLSTEVGYQRARYAEDTWNWEIRPIVDKTSGRWYWAINPALERAWHGPGVALGIDFAPNVKVSYDFTKKITAASSTTATTATSATSPAFAISSSSSSLPSTSTSRPPGSSTSALA